MKNAYDDMKSGLECLHCGKEIDGNAPGNMRECDSCKDKWDSIETSSEGKTK